MFQYNLYRSKMLQGYYQDCYAKQMLLLSIALYLYTTASMMRSGRILIHSYTIVLAFLVCHYHIRFYVEQSERWPFIDSNTLSVSYIDSIEVMCLLIQMNYLPHLLLFQIDIHDERVIDEIIDLRISLC